MIVERNERDCFVFEPEEPGIVDHPPTFLITRVSKGKPCEGAIEKQYINKLKRRMGYKFVLEWENYFKFLKLKLSSIEYMFSIFGIANCSLNGKRHIYWGREGGLVRPDPIF